jgi:hypothetical protein
MPKEKSSSTAHRLPSPTTVMPHDQVSQSLVQVKSLAQSILCAAACAAVNHEDLVFSQVQSFKEEAVEGAEGVEVGEESLLRKDYGIYRV